jgi:hypothetical protein
MGSSDSDNAHASTDTASNFGAGFLTLLGEHGGQFPHQDLGFFAEETIWRHHKRRNLLTVLEASPEVFLLCLAFMS